MTEKFPKDPAPQEQGKERAAIALTHMKDMALQTVKALIANPDLTKTPEGKKSIGSGIEIILGGMPLLNKALQDPALMPVALAVADVCTRIPRVNEYSGPIVAAHADQIVKYMLQYPNDMVLPLDVLGRTSANLLDQADITKDAGMRRRAGKIFRAVEKKIPEIQLYFSKANPATSENMHQYALALNVLAFLTTGYNAKKWHDWLYDSIAQTIVSIASNKDYSDVPTNGTYSDMDLFDHDRALSTLPMRFSSRDLIDVTLRSVDSAARIEVYLKLFAHYDLPLEFLLVGNMKNGAKFALETCVRQNPEEGMPAPRDIMVDQIEAVAALDNERPGAAGVLFTQFGIRFFSRYPLELLVKQYDERHQHIPYGVVVSAVWDNNNSFFAEGEKELYRKLSRNLDAAGSSMRFIEASTEPEFQEHLTYLKDIYAASNKASFLMIRGHGHAWNVAFGPDEEEGDLLRSHLEKRNYAKFKDVFAPDFPTIFEACSIGRKGGLAQEWSRVFGNTVYAAKGLKSALHDVDVEIREGKTVFSPTYEVFKEQSTPPRIYVNGKDRNGSVRPR